MVKEQKQVIDIQAGKGFTLAQSNEHLRVASRGAYIANLSNNFDPTREHLNFEVGKGGVVLPVDKGKSIPARIRQNLKSRGIQDPNEGLDNPRYRTVANIILGGSTEQMRNLAFGDQDVDYEKGADNSNIQRKKNIENWAVDMYKFMSRKYGEENIAAFVVHLDEKNPHIHCTVLPVTKDNKISWKKVMIGPVNDKFAYSRQMKLLHSEMAEVNEKYGLHRGDKIADTKAKHRTTAQYHEEERRKLSNEIIEQKEKIEENRKTLTGQNKNIIHAEARVKGLSTMIKNLNDTKTKLESERCKLEREVKEGLNSKEAAQNRLSEINIELKSIEEKITDKKNKLEEAENKLKAIQTQLQASQKELDKVEPETKLKVMHEMQAVGWNYVVTDTQRRYQDYLNTKEGMSFSEQNFIDKVNQPLFEGDSIIEGMAENGAEVLAVATNLFLGYVDAATAISQSAGGGESPTKGWGKKKDEDDKDFQNRCFLMAVHMLRSGKKKQIKK